MKKTLCVLAACLLCFAVLASSAHAQGGTDAEGRDPAFEREIDDRLAAIAPQAVPLFQAATQAMDAGELDAARRGYEQVLALAPDFPDANRRLSYIYRAQGDPQGALACAERAYGAAPSPYNELALALALIGLDDASQAPQALVHAKAAAQALPDDVDAQHALFGAAAANNDLETMRQANAALQQLAPDSLGTHWTSAIVAAIDGRWKEADRELSLAEEMGLPADAIRGLHEAIDTRLRRRRWTIAGASTLGGWLIAPLLLLVTGSLLSRLTLAAVRRTQATARFEVSRGERAMRTVYRGVIALSAVYFYTSLPLLAVIVTAGSAGILYAFWTGPGIPARLAAGLVVLVIFTLYAIVRGVFVRIREQEPGRALSREEAPRLWALAEQVAQRVGTEPIERITVTPAPTIGVTERGRRWFRPRSAGKRTLLLGLGALNRMTQGQFAAILAHEYGHFSNRDTAGGDLANRVGASIWQMARSLAASGQARWYNPAWLFLRGFERLFVRITRGASRLQEVLADRYAALAYGAHEFVAGLKQIVRQGVAFHIQAGHEIEAALGQGQEVPNLFVLAPPADEQVRERVEAEIEKEMTRETRPYDAHPAPKERIALVERLATKDERPAGNAEPAWALIGDPAALQAEMMGIVRDNVNRQAVRAPDKTKEGAPDRTEESVPDKTKESRPDQAGESPPAEERPPWHRNWRVRFYPGLFALIGAILLGSFYILSRQLRWLLGAIALALVCAGLWAGPSIRRWVSGTRGKP